MAVNAIIASLITIASAQVAVATYSTIYCYPPIVPLYGGYSPKKDHYGVGYSIEYFCDEGYVLRGVATAECAYEDESQTSARFSGEPPSCEVKEVTCPDLVHPTYGSVSVSGYTPHSSARYECQDGYKLKGHDYIKCREDGTWSGSAPTCIRSICPNLDDPVFGHVDVDERTPGSEAHYECDEGYKLVGVAYRRCLDDCTWSSDPPVCEPIRCPLLPAPTYGSVTAKGNSPGKTSHYSCNAGYKLVGEPYRTCHYDGLWDGEAPTCIPAKCPVLASPNHAHVNQENRSPGTQAHYECYKGYKLVGNEYQTCLENCEWSGEAPKCIPIKCAEHSAPDHGIVSYTGYTPGSRVNYECNSGYKIVGLTYRTCGYDGIWTGKKPHCIQSRCRRLDIIEYGNINVTSYSPGSRAHYYCYRGYKLVGDPYRTCHDDCEWSGEPPRCVPIKCPGHNSPQYGYVNFTGYRPENRAQYTCYPGYKLVGVPYRTCGYDGVWDGVLPRCIPSKCPQLEDIDYGSVSIPSYKPGSRAHYTCYKGYKLVGEPYRTCQDDCEWDGEPPRCVAIKCPGHDAPQYGYVNFTGYRPENRSQYTCYPGYKLVGVPYRTCGYDGVWKGVIPRCIPSKCPNLEDIEYGNISISSYKPGSRAHYICYKGYKLAGEAYRTCQDDCEWDGEPPRCVPIKCPGHNSPQYGYVNFTGYRPENRAQYTCYPGYKLVGVPYRTCGYDGMWKGVIPRCIPSKCPQLEDIDYGSVSIPSYKPGSRAHYTCYKGYKLVGEPYRTCQDDCEWAGEPPRCVPIKCPGHDAPQYGYVNFTGYRPENRSQYTCYPGYKLVGVPYRTCGYDGVWKGVIPRCIPSKCPNLEDIEYGNISISSYKPGSRAHYICYKGYKLVGEAYRTCQDDCEWDGEPPRCVPIKCPGHNSPQYGYVNFTGYRPENRAQYSCYPGYKLVGVPYRTCGYDGVWKGVIPRCIPSKCPQLKDIEYGSVAIPSYKPGSRAHYTCYKGYKLVGEPYRTCQDDCEWDGEPPRCVAIKCPGHDAPQYGYVNFTGYRPENRSQYTCYPGYKLVGVPYRTCGYDGVWKGVIPRCIPSKCPNLEDIEYGNISISSYKPGSRAHYICYKGYKLVGEAYRTCQDDCEWDGEPPRCVPIKCPGHNSPQYGYVNFTGYRPENRAQYSCYPGYKLVGVPYRTCGYDGVWKGVIPRCIPSKCPQLKDIEYGSVAIPSYKPGSRAHYTCYKGYKLVGEPYRTCQDDCEWDGEPPRCVAIKCPGHDAPQYGYVNFTGYRPENRSQYTCYPGYKLVGVPYRTCGYDGVWKGVIPRCIPSKCPNLEDIEYGNISISSYKPGSTAHYICYKGYKLVGEAYRTCQDDCEWDGEPPRCVPIKCPGHNSPQYGYVNFTGYRPENRAQYSCYPGYKLVGVPYRTCGYDGVWKKVIPRCIPSKCPQLKDIEYGSVFIPSYKPGSRAHYTCYKGYKLVGEPYRTCQDDCEWAGESPRCVPIKCPGHDAPQYGYVNFTGYRPENRSQYTCYPGYKLVGVPYRTCGYDGVWKGVIPRCIPSKCPNLEDIEYGNISISSYKPGSRAHYICYKGYKLVGEAYRTCQDDCEWDGEPPRCVPIKCPGHNSPQYGYVNFTGYRPENRAQYSCYPGYKLVGVPYRTCGYNGVWKGVIPRCIPSKCPQLKDIDYGSVSIPSYKPGSRAHYTCYKGYKLVGEPYRTCQDDCEWAGEPPRCVPIKCPGHDAPQYGYVNFTGYRPENRSQYTCYPGYKLVGVPYRTCGYDGVWKGVIPRCILSKCPNLEDIEYGNISISSYKPGSRAHYICYKGYKLVGEAYRTCQDDCEWDGEPPRCVPIKCPGHNSPQYGYVNFTGYRPENRAQYTCYPGYKLVGVPYRTCGYDGVWKGVIPSCIPSKCPQLKDIEYGSVAIPSYKPGSRAHYTCYKGYKLVGEPYRSCQDDCAWGGEPPRCVPIKCPEHNASQYGYVNFTGYRPENRSQYSCYPGYKLVGVPYRTCGYDGVWDGVIPKCIPSRCPNLRDPFYGSVNISSFKPGSQAHYMCRKGYKLVGDPYRTCQEDCEWSGEAPKCVPITCTKHGAPKYGMSIFSGYRPGHRVFYRCKPGYKINGLPIRICGYDGQWTGDKPQCVLAQCPNLEDPEYGSVNVPRRTLGSKARYTCNKGYRLYGYPWRKCLRNCKWSGKQPNCKLIKCAPLRKPRYGAVNTTLNDMGNNGTARYQCNDGYKLVGNPDRACQYGYWYNRPPQCKPLKCHRLPYPKYGSVRTTAYTVGSTAKYTCRYGYVLVGKTNRTCQDDEHWSGEAPICKAINCPKLEKPEYGQVYTTSLTVSARANYRCNYGYKLVGDSRRRCQTSGKWTGTAPVCKRKP